MKMLSVLVACVLGAQSDDSAADREVIGALTAGIAQRLDGCTDLKFTYRATSASAGSPPVESRNVLKVMRTDQKGGVTGWRCWEQYVQRHGQEVLNRCLGFNGTESRTFQFTDPKESRFNKGVVRVAPDATEFTENCFDTILCLDINGIPRFIDPSGTVSAMIDNRYHLVEKRESNGRTTYVLKGEGSPGFGVHYEAHVVGKPDFIVTLLKMTDAKNGDLLEQHEVTAVGHRGPLAYPISGSFLRKKVGELKAVEYTFSDVFVEPLYEKDRGRWFPEWPKGTVIVDYKENIVKTIPLGVNDLIRGELEEMVKVGKSTKPPSMRRPLFLLSLGLAAAVIVFFAWRLWRLRPS